jgi:hypothetical protein
MKPFAVSTRSSMLLLLLLVAGTFRQAVCSQNGKF